MDGKKTVVWQYREWVDDIVDICILQSCPTRATAQDRKKWNQIVTRHQTPNTLRPGTLLSVSSTLCCHDYDAGVYTMKSVMREDTHEVLCRMSLCMSLPHLWVDVCSMQTSRRRPLHCWRLKIGKNVTQWASPVLPPSADQWKQNHATKHAELCKSCSACPLRPHWFYHHHMCQPLMPSVSRSDRLWCK